MKAIIDSNKDVVVENITITGACDTRIASFVTFTAPLETTNLADLLSVRQAGFSFFVRGDIVHITSRKLFTEFI